MIGLTHANHRLILQIIKMQYCCLNFQSLDSVHNLIEQSMESNQPEYNGVLQKQIEDHTKSSEDKASSPTTAFIACTSFPIA